MKTAVSLPDDVFRNAERYAHKMGKSRSQLYGEALRQYLLQHAPDAITDAMNSVCDQVNQKEDAPLQRATRKLLRSESW